MSSGFHSTKIINTSTRKDEVNHLTINITDGLSSEFIGDTKIISFNDIYLSLPEVEGRYKLKARAINELRKHNINTLGDMLRMAWLLDNGDWILRNLKKI